MAFVKDLNKRSVRRAMSRKDILPTFNLYELCFRGVSAYGIPRTFIFEVAALTDVEAWSVASLHCARKNIKFESRVGAVHLSIDRSFLDGKTRRHPAVLSLTMREYNHNPALRLSK